MKAMRHEDGGVSGQSAAEPSLLAGAPWLAGVPLRGVLRAGESLVRHCSWRAGGRADRYFEPADLADLVTFLKAAPASEPVTFIGFGSNLLVRDGGLRGTLIATATALLTLDWRDEHTLHAGAGVACAKVARLAVRRGLGGGEFLAGIPGTIGGALAMNAGAFGHEIWPLVQAVTTLDRHGELRERVASEYASGYRQLTAPADEWFVACTLMLAADTHAASRVRSLLALRSQTQPLGLPSCGSVFKNPPGDFAGRLIEAVGLKGHRRGGACVSLKHANFIINEGGATAADIEGLMEEVRAAVEARFGVRLESEVRLLGEVAA